MRWLALSGLVALALDVATIGVTVGTAGAPGLTRTLETLLFDVKPADRVTSGAVTALVVGAAAAACYVPARRATRADPVEALRQE